MTKKKKLNGNVFAEGMKTLAETFNYSPGEGQLKVYYKKLAEDFDDVGFQVAVAIILETEYRFPPIAAFYKTKPSSTTSPFYGGV